MYRKDFILNEAQTLALILAKLMGLKTEEFIQLADNTLLKEYNISFDELLNLSLQDFELRLAEENYSVDKIDALAQLLYLNSEPFSATAEYYCFFKKCCSFLICSNKSITGNHLKILIKEIKFINL